MQLGAHILIVDDDAGYADILGQVLRRRGYAVSWAETPAAALSQAERAAPDAAIVDLRLAQTSGLDLIAPLRARHPALRILLLTGYASIATAVSAIKLGADQYLAKPAAIDDILTALGERTAEKTAAPEPTPMSVDRLEWEHIQKVLNEHAGNISATARALKMHRRTLQRKLGKRPVRD